MKPSTDTVDARAAQVVAEVARETGRAWKSPHPHLRARLRSGATVADCVLVALCKHHEWGGGKLARYVRQATLYSRERFDRLLAQAVEWDRRRRSASYPSPPAAAKAPDRELHRCPPGDAAARDQARSWARDEFQHMLLRGRPGAGKTHLAAAVNEPARGAGHEA